VVFCAPGCCEPAVHQRLLMADSVSSQPRQVAAFRREGLAAQWLLSADIVTSRSRPADGGDGQLSGIPKQPQTDHQNGAPRAR
ncbi:MAG: hypothetical protein ACRC2B_10165, partial [Rubrivivax sp.]